MALIPCPECRQRISETAERCPNCGYILTPEEVAKIKETKKKRPTRIMGYPRIIGYLILFVPFVIIAILAILYSPESATTGTQQDRAKSSTGTSTYNDPPQRPQTVETEPPSAQVMSVSPPSERPETVETQQEQTAANEVWLGTWSLEFINGEPTAKNLASGLGSDIFISWNYTFYADGQFESKLHQDTGDGIITTTASGTYEISANTYNTVLKEAIMSMGSTSVPIPNVTSYQSGTWSRRGDTLTMIPVGSSTKVFKLLETPQTISPAEVSTEYDQKPRPLKQVVPKYPEDAREKPQTTPPTEVSTEYDETPRVLRKTKPKYPEAARRAQKEGLVTLEFTVGVDGKATDIKVVEEKPKGFGFGAEAVEAVKKWRFTPAKRDGENVPMRAKIPIRFTLE